MSLDVSIKNLKPFVFGSSSNPLTPNTQRKKAEYIISKRMIGQEKIDGTKLTLVRTDNDSNIYSENWVVSYKNNVLYSEEFDNLSSEDIDRIKQSATGISQYALVFDHLKRINDKVKSVPKNTEFSIEFAQKKETLTRTYKSTGTLFLRTYAHTEYYVKNGKLVSIPSNEETDVSKISRMASFLEIESFPTWINGYINSQQNSNKAIVNDSLRSNFLGMIINWSDPTDILNKFSTAVLNTNSVLGGKPEGIVLQLEDGELFKIVQEDQYDKETRYTKKQEFRADEEFETKYFQKIRGLVRQIFESINMESPTPQIMSQFVKVLTKIKPSIEGKIQHPKKNIDQIVDDLHETAKLIINKIKLLGKDTQTISLIPIAGKPFHIGHWKLIEIASQNNDRVVVYLSVKDRKRSKEIFVSGKDSMLLWKNIYLKYLPKNVKIEFVDSPVQSLFYELQWLDQQSGPDNLQKVKVNLYSDESDIESNFPIDRIQKYTPNNSNIINRIGVPRNRTVNISGTQMRRFIEDGDDKSFKRYLPPVSDNEKNIIWDMMSKKKFKNESN